MSTTKILTVVTVTYNSEETIIKLLSSLKLINDLIKEIIIIDNNSSFLDKDKIQKISKKIKLIINKKNYGFARAVNQGIKKSKTDFVLLINPDTFLSDRSIIKSLNLIKDDEKIGAIGGKIYDINHNILYTANRKPSFLTGIFEFTNLKKIFPENKYSKLFWVESSRKILKPIKVSSLCGAYIIIRKKINNKNNLFDKKYFLYMEDVDFGIKINKEGYKVIFDPRSHIFHIGGFSSKNKYKTDLKSWYKSREIFFYKNLSWFKAIILISVFNIEKVILNIYHFIKHDSEA